MVAVTASTYQFAASGSPLSMNNSLIAIIDDDALVRMSVQRLVRSMNFKAAQFTSPDEFLESGYLQDVRCVICDVHIAGGSSELLQHRLTSIGYDIPIVFMTALPDRAKQEQMLAAGAICVLTKPFHQDEMASCIAAAFKRHNTETKAKASRSPAPRRDRSTRGDNP
jgi:FixJ family two-component response regulator